MDSLQRMIEDRNELAACLGEATYAVANGEAWAELDLQRMRHDLDAADEAIERRRRRERLARMEACEECRYRVRSRAQRVIDWMNEGVEA